MSRSAFTLCGCYYYVQHALHYLPRMDMSAHTTIAGSSSSTTLRQTFNNMLDTAIPELSYAFPLYDGVSVVEFKATIDSRQVVGVVKEREAAKAEYQAAKDKGEAAALVEQSLAAADVFNMRIGNIGPKESVVVELVYLGELDHDTQIDGLRFQIPTRIAPRYGSYSTEGPVTGNVREGGIAITVDVEMPATSVIKSVQSPSHPLSVSIGTTSKAPDADPSLQKASATLSLDANVLADDFVMQVVATNLDEPAAILEVHPTISNQRALMATLVPKFSLPSESPEIVFVCDRSGSMSGQIHNLKAALNVFLKSLPVGVKFNICSFGSSYSFLWKKSKAYSQGTLDEATKHVAGFSANFGGTEMYNPVEETFKRRYTDMNLEVFLLTDGEIWGQDSLFSLVNQEVDKSKGAIRVFSLGIGAGASTSLVKGVARAGRGFAQFTQDNERMDKKIVRMLKASLMPHVNNYTLEIKYEQNDDDFELVEKVQEVLAIAAEDAATKSEVSKSPISLFSKNHKEEPIPAKTDPSNIPDIPAPRYLQTPSEIPALFPFNRTCVYVLLSDSTSPRTPTSVVLRGTCSAGPLELEIPITILPERAATIHRLAARKELKELEEGRGWPSLVKVGNKSLQDVYPGRYADIVEREGVRIGTLFQVASKWTSFVAVQQRDTDSDSLKTLAVSPPEEPQSEGTYAGEMSFGGGGARRMRAASKPKGGSVPQANMASPDVLASLVRGYELAAAPPPPPPGGFFAAPPPCRASAAHGSPPEESDDDMGFGLFGGSRTPSPPVAPAPACAKSFGAPKSAKKAHGGLFGAAGGALSRSGGADKEKRSGGGMGGMPPLQAQPTGTSRGLFGGLFGASKLKPGASPIPPPPAAVAAAASIPKTETLTFAELSAPPKPANPLEGLTALQKFQGNWQWDATLEAILGVTRTDAEAKTTVPDAVKSHSLYADILATACAITYLKKHLAADKDVWEMMVDKAEAWLREQTSDLAVVDAVTCI